MAFTLKENNGAEPETDTHHENGRAKQDAMSVFDRDDADEEKRGASISDPGPTWSKDEEKKALMKLDWNLIPLYVTFACQSREDSRVGLMCGMADLALCTWSLTSIEATLEMPTPPASAVNGELPQTTTPGL